MSAVEPTMRAAVLRRHGEPPEFGLHPAPRRTAGRVLIKVTAAPVNPLDLLCASGTSYFGAPALPYVPGTQGVGVVAEVGVDSEVGEVGASVGVGGDSEGEGDRAGAVGGPGGAVGVVGGRLAAGQRVWFSCDAGMAPGDGSMAELCLADESAVLPLPGEVADDLCAALGLSAIAAWMALAWRGGLRPGEHVLVLGASGTVGQVGVQAARLLGAERVVAACRDATGRARATDLGADAVADLSGDDPDEIAGRLAEVTNGRVDLVLDPVWGRPAQAALRVLSPGGRLVNLGSSAGPAASLGSAVLRSGMISVLGYTNAALSPELRAAAMREILAHASAGRLTADRLAMPLTSVADGWSRCGKPPYRRVVLIPQA